MTDEERAEEWCKNNMDICKEEGVLGEVPYFGAEERCVAKSAYLDGLHADRWHYPSKGELPDKDGRYWVMRYDDVSRTLFADILWFENNTWWNRLHTGDYAVRAWQYIVPPQEEV